MFSAVLPICALSGHFFLGITESGEMQRRTSLPCSAPTKLSKFLTPEFLWAAFPSLCRLGLKLTLQMSHSTISIYVQRPLCCDHLLTSLPFTDSSAVGLCFSPLFGTSNCIVFPGCMEVCYVF